MLQGNNLAAAHKEKNGERLIHLRSHWLQRPPESSFRSYQQLRLDLGGTSRRTRTIVRSRACLVGRELLQSLCAQSGQPEGSRMRWKSPTPEDWLRFAFVVLVIVGVTGTLIIALTYLR